MILTGKTIVITWASDGIGKAIGLQAARENTRLALLWRSVEKLETVKQEALNLGAKQVFIYSCDLCNTESIVSTTQNIVSDLGNIDILINNAWIWQKMVDIDSVSEKIVEDVIATNLTGLIHMTRLLLPEIRKASEGAIINVSSQSWFVAQAWQTVYTATKYGVRGFTEVLKVDLKDTNIRIAWVYQAWTNTEMFATSGEDKDTSNFTEPSDLADVILFMLSRPEKIWLHDVRVEF
jgi:short-subunit dehydrogenase